MRIRSGAPHILVRVGRAIAVALGRFARDQWGVETAEVVLVVPLLVGVVWSALEIWQIMSLRSTVRNAVSQAARYVTAYASPAPDRPYDPGQVAWGVEKIIEDTLSRSRGIMGDALQWDIVWYHVYDPSAPAWDENILGYPMGETIYFLSGLQCNDQFGLKLRVAAPWRTVLFGLKGTTDREWVLRLYDTAVGAVPCTPVGCEFDDFNPERDITVEDPIDGYCRATIRWRFKWEAPFTYLPQHVWIVDEYGELLDLTTGVWPQDAVAGAIPGNQVTVRVPDGTTDVTIVAGQFNELNPSNSWGECQVSASIHCGAPEPTRTPTPPGL